MTRIALDMDDVLADTLGTQIAWFNERHGYRLTLADMAGPERFGGRVAPHHDAEMTAWMREGSFFADLPVLPGAVEVVRRLTGRYEIFVASAATEFPGSFLPKFRWLERHFPFIPASHVVFCGDKCIVDADVLIDDNAHLFPRFRGQRILFDAPHNAHVADLPRVRSWEEVATRFLGAPSASARACHRSVAAGA